MAQHHIQLNLASQPFENQRRTVVLTSLAGIILLGTAAFLVTNFVRLYRSERGLAAQIDSARREIARLDAEEQRLNEQLRRPEAVDVMDRSEFLNGLIYQKAISWTQIFMDLEKIMPPRVQVMSLRPVASKPGGRTGAAAPRGPLEMDLHLEVSGDNVAALLEMVRNMEKSQVFQNPVFNIETPANPANPMDNLYKLVMSVRYAQS
jgi:Tfp pilus assembly protein PilN